MYKPNAKYLIIFANRQLSGLPLEVNLNIVGVLAASKLQSLKTISDKRILLTTHTNFHKLLYDES